MIRKVILADPPTSPTITGILSLTEPTKGEQVSIFYGLKFQAYGEVTDVRKAPDWPGAFRFDVQAVDDDKA